MSLKGVDRHADDRNKDNDSVYSLEGTSLIPPTHYEEDWKERFTSELIQQIRHGLSREPSLKETERVPRWKGEIAQESAKAYLRELTVYLSWLKLDKRSRLNLIQNAMVEQAAGWFETQRQWVHNFRDVCLAFLEKYVSDEMIKDEKKRYKRTIIRWNTVQSLEKQIYLLIDKFRKTDESMLDNST